MARAVRRPHARFGAKGAKGDDAGVTLVETLVAMVLTMVVGGIVLAATVSTHKSLRVSDDETRGQEDVAVVVDRLARDIRDARGVVCDGAADDPTCITHLQLWSDYNSNYKQDTGETISWKLRKAADGEHYDMLRTTDTGASQVEARTIVRNVAFTYDVPPTASQPAPGETTTKTVTVTMYYDAMTSSGSATRTVTFATMLRNVP